MMATNNDLNNNNNQCSITEGSILSMLWDMESLMRQQKHVQEWSLLDMKRELRKMKGNILNDKNQCDIIYEKALNKLPWGSMTIIDNEFGLKTIVDIHNVQAMKHLSFSGTSNDGTAEKSYFLLSFNSFFLGVFVIGVMFILNKLGVKRKRRQEQLIQQQQIQQQQEQQTPNNNNTNNVQQQQQQQPPPPSPTVETICTICLVNDRNRVLVPCGHIFCDDCITEVRRMQQQQQPRCPICRTGFTTVVAAFL
jgi:hypothetical protein